MSYLYEHRDKLGEHRRFAEIAYSVTFNIPPEDREDVEERIVTTLIELSKKVKPESETIFWKHARFVVADYWDRKYREWERYSLIHESGRGETVAGERRYLVAPDGLDARLDAIAILSTLPQRLIEIGIKKLNGQPLSNAEHLYRQKQTRKLRPERPGRITEEEKQRIIELNLQGFSNSEIVRITGRSQPSINIILREAGVSSPWSSRLEKARTEKVELVKQALKEGKSINRIARETHTWKDTVRRVAKGKA